MDMNTGIYYDLSDREYHNSVGISKSKLDLINISPATLRANIKNKRPETEPFRTGRALHCLVLEPEEFHKRYAEDPNPGSQSKDAKFLRNKIEKDGRTVISSSKDKDYWKPGTWEQIHYMRDAIVADPTASKLLNLANGKPEVSVYWKDPETELQCRSRIDFLNTHLNMAIDLKSTDDASESGFNSSVIKFRYNVQDFMYTEGLRRNGIDIDFFLFVCVEKKPPYLVKTHLLSNAWKEVGFRQYRENLDRYRDCLLNDEWPGLSDGVSILEPPNYLTYKENSSNSNNEEW